MKQKKLEFKQFSILDKIAQNGSKTLKLHGFNVYIFFCKDAKANALRNIDLKVRWLMETVGQA